MLVKELTTRTAEGCRIASRAEPADSERLYGPSCMEQIEFPPPRALGGSSRVAGVTEVLERLLPHLERGVLLWVAPEGVFMKRQCQGRVYWNGPLAPHRDWPNKLEREKTYKLLDTQQFLQRKCPRPPATLGDLQTPRALGTGPVPGTASGGTRASGRCLAELRRYLSQGQPAPQYQIHLCFGEEYPTSASHHFQKLIMAHVSPCGGGAHHNHEQGGFRGADPILPAALCLSAGGAGVRAGALPSRPAHRPHAAARLPPALCPRRSRPHRPRPPAALPALSGAAEARRSLDRAHGCGARCSASPRLRSGPGDERPPSSDAASAVRGALGTAGTEVGGCWMEQEPCFFPRTAGNHLGGGWVLVGRAGQRSGLAGDSQLRPCAWHRGDALFVVCKE